MLLLIIVVRSKDPNNIDYTALYSFINNFIIYLKNNSYNIFSKLIPKFRMKIFESVYSIFKLHLNEIILNIFLNKKTILLKIIILIILILKVLKFLKFYVKIVIMILIE